MYDSQDPSDPSELPEFLTILSKKYGDYIELYDKLMIYDDTSNYDYMNNPKHREMLIQILERSEELMRGLFKTGSEFCDAYDKATAEIPALADDEKISKLVESIRAINSKLGPGLKRLDEGL